MLTLALQFSIRLRERNGAFEIAGRIQNPNLTRAKACVALRSCGRKSMVLSNVVKVG
jgi:hypothetical protein